MDFKKLMQEAKAEAGIANTKNSNFATSKVDVSNNDVHAFLKTQKVRVMKSSQMYNILQLASDYRESKYALVDLRGWQEYEPGHIRDFAPFVDVSDLQSQISQVKKKNNDKKISMVYCVQRTDVITNAVSLKDQVKSWQLEKLHSEWIQEVYCVSYADFQEAFGFLCMSSQDEKTPASPKFLKAYSRHPIIFSENLVCGMGCSTASGSRLAYGAAIKGQPLFQKLQDLKFDQNQKKKVNNQNQLSSINEDEWDYDQSSTQSQNFQRKFSGAKSLKLNTDYIREVVELFNVTDILIVEKLDDGDNSADWDAAESSEDVDESNKENNMNNDKEKPNPDDVKRLMQQICGGGGDAGTGIGSSGQQSNVTIEHKSAEMAKKPRDRIGSVCGAQEVKDMFARATFSESGVVNGLQNLHVVSDVLSGVALVDQVMKRIVVQNEQQVNGTPSSSDTDSQQNNTQQNSPIQSYDLMNIQNEYSDNKENGKTKVLWVIEVIFQVKIAPSNTGKVHGEGDSQIVVEVIERAEDRVYGNQEDKDSNSDEDDADAESEQMQKKKKFSKFEITQIASADLHQDAPSVMTGYYLRSKPNWNINLALAFVMKKIPQWNCTTQNFALLNQLARSK